MKIRLIVFLVLALIGASCSTSPSSTAPTGPEPGSSPGYFVTAKVNFDLSPGEGVKYALSFVTRKDWPTPLYVRAQLENPSDRDHPFDVTVDRVDKQLLPEQILYVASSPPITRIKNNHTYRVTFNVYDDENYSHRIGSHQVKRKFYLPADFARSAGVDVGK